jgi:hypothetical protein
MTYNLEWWEDRTDIAIIYMFITDRSLNCQAVL